MWQLVRNEARRHLLPSRRDAVNGLVSVAAVVVAVVVVVVAVDESAEWLI